MNETRFIELLNLYVDQQLTAAEAAELEAELQHNPARRKTYQQYCRMQKACAMLFDREQKTAPSSKTLARALAEADEKIVAFPQQRPAWVFRGLLAGGAAAAAACLVLVFVHRGSVRQEDVASHPAPVAVAPAAVVATEVARVPESSVAAVAIPPADPQLQSANHFAYSILPVRQLVPVTVVAPGAEGLAENANPDFAWMKKVKLSPMRPVSADELLAGAKAQKQPLQNGYLPASSISQGMFENAAFQYQKGN